MRLLTAACAISAVALSGCALDTIQTIEKSMEPTILSGERVHLDFDAYDHAQPREGEIVALRGPAGAEREECGVRSSLRGPCPEPTPEKGDMELVKRVVATPGEKIAIDARGRAVVNGSRLDEPWIQECSRRDFCALPRAITVPAGHYFVLGDNRPYSSDSRYWGPVPLAAIDGRVTPPDPSRR